MQNNKKSNLLVIILFQLYIALFRWYDVVLILNYNYNFKIKIEILDISWCVCVFTIS